jgi:hypothetical protein
MQFVGIGRLLGGIDNSLDQRGSGRPERRSYHFRLLATPPVGAAGKIAALPAPV